MRPSTTDEEFIDLFRKMGATKLSKHLGVNERNIHSRRRAIEGRRNIELRPPQKYISPNADHLIDEVDNGVVIIGSDAHYWPGEPTTAHRAFVYFCKELKPKIVVKNGDQLDGATISRHAKVGWESKPSLIQELEVTKERLDEIYKVTKSARHYWPLGNHDARFETRLANVAPEYAKIYGVHLKDHFPEWTPCWSVWINDEVVVKHRWKGGRHATFNNTVYAGKSMITGHLHSLKVSPFTDYNGTRFGVDCGTMAEPTGEQFRDYTETSPKDWRSGFVVLTFKNKKLLWPEIVHVTGDSEINFRGEMITV